MERCHYCRADLPDAAKVHHDGSHWWFFCCFTDCYILWKIETLRSELASLERLLKP